MFKSPKSRNAFKLLVFFVISQLSSPEVSATRIYIKSGRQTRIAAHVVGALNSDCCSKENERWKSKISHSERSSVDMLGKRALKDTRSSEQRLYESYCTFQPILAASKNRVNVYTAAASSLERCSSKRHNITIQNYILGYELKNPGTMHDEDRASFLNYEHDLNQGEDIYLGKIPNSSNDSYETAPNHNCSVDSKEEGIKLHVLSSEIENKGKISYDIADIEERQEDKLANIAEGLALLSEGEDDHIPTVLEVGIDLSCENNSDRNYTKSSSLVKSLATYYRQLSKAGQRTDRDNNNNDENNNELITVPMKSLKDSMNLKSDAKREEIPRKSLQMPSGYEKSILFLKKARLKREEENRVKKSLEMRHYDPNNDIELKVVSKEKEDDLDSLIVRSFRFPTDIRDHQKRNLLSMKSNRLLCEKSSIDNLSFDEIEPFVHYDSAIPSIDPMIVSWVKSFRSSSPVKNVIKPLSQTFDQNNIIIHSDESALSLIATNVIDLDPSISLNYVNSSDNDNLDCDERKIIGNSNNESTIIYTPLKDDKYINSNNYSSETYHSGLSSIKENSSFHNDGAYVTSSSDLLLFSTINSNSKNNVSNRNRTFPTKKNQIQPQGKMANSNEKGRDYLVGGNLYEKNVSPNYFYSPPCKQESAPGPGPDNQMKKTQRISRSHQKLLEKYQSILGIDLDAFDGSIKTFKTVTALKL